MARVQGIGVVVSHADAGHVLFLPCFLIFYTTVVLYALSAVYFAGVMVRLMLTLTPVVCVLATIAISKTLHQFLV